MGKPTPPIDLSDPQYYLNRELSLLAFHTRVLRQARDSATPLLERLRFLTISTSNLDEFMEVRVAGLKQRIALALTKPDADGVSPREVLKQVGKKAHKLVARQYRELNEVILPALEEEGIRVLRRDSWKGPVKKWVRDYFNEHVLPVLTPVGLDPAHPFPQVLNKSLNFIVSLEGEDAFDRESGTAVVQVPRVVPRLIHLPKDVSGGPSGFVLLSSVIHANMGEIFPGMTITGCYQFRVTRNSDLWVDEDEVDDLLHALKGELPRRRYGSAVRLEMPTHSDPDICAFLLDQFQLSQDDLYLVDGPVNLHRLQALYDAVDRPDLKYPPFIPGVSHLTDDIFELLRKQDVLLHHPYHSFAPVMDFIRQAATDPDVLAIKMTVYRTGQHSSVADALLDAARAGKEVTAVVELRARFDEAANIDLATRLQEAGAKVAYGVVGYKTHAKLVLVVRREGTSLRRYAHLGTGNYHPGTARAYTDLGLLTSNEAICSDVHEVFQGLTGLGKIRNLTKLLQSPFTLHKTLIKLIEHEAHEANQGRPARIVAKMNSLNEPKTIRALYEASQAGVHIDLLVRGICCLRPGVPGVSETIRVRSHVGRFLEHSRIYCFFAGGENVTLCGSADWMGRNLFRRVEVAFPVEDPALRARIQEDLQAYLDDNTQAWELDSDGRYRRLKPGEEETPVTAQRLLLEKLADVHPAPQPT